MGKIVGPKIVFLAREIREIRSEERNIGAECRSVPRNQGDLAGMFQAMTIAEMLYAHRLLE